MTVRIAKVLAPNPGPFTAEGTNSWVVDSGGELVVIDPGPAIAEHFEAIIREIGDRPVSAIVVTHTHPDHAPLANPLAREFSVAAYGFGPGPEFEPDLCLSDGDSLRFGQETWHVIHTPGHSEDHVCLLVGRILFTGDHIIGGSSVMVEAMTPYLDSLRRLQGLDLERLYPGHGPEIAQPQEVIAWYLAHRLQREAEIIEAIGKGASDVGSIVDMVYSNVDLALHPLAARSVLAHLKKLADDGRIRLEGERVGDSGFH
jgi:glyoxylase-like metal-dependent hydrolase (beta-lactamase superfamily II)